MEKDIGKISKNQNTDIVVRIDDFGGKTGITIREFVTGADGGYSGFTKSGTRIPAEKFLEFRELINTISIVDLNSGVQGEKEETSASKQQHKKHEKLDIKEETI